MRRLLFLCACALVNKTNFAVKQDVKIVAGEKIDRNQPAATPNPSPSSSTTTETIASRAPAVFDSSDLLSGLFGSCFEKEQDDYIYTFCPLKNFTQKNLPSHYSPNTYILGIWGSWIDGDRDIHPKYSQLYFNDGTECTPSLKRSTTIYLECIPYEELVAPAQPIAPPEAKNGGGAQIATALSATSINIHESSTKPSLPGADPPNSNSNPQPTTTSIPTPTTTRTCTAGDNGCLADEGEISSAEDESNAGNGDDADTADSDASTIPKNTNVQPTRRTLPPVHKLVLIKEPSPCQYEAHFATTLVPCDVYPPEEERNARKAAAVAAREAREKETPEEGTNKEDHAEVIRKLREELGRTKDELTECRSTPKDE